MRPRTRRRRRARDACRVPRPHGRASGGLATAAARGGGAPRYTRRMTRTYVAVVVVEAAVLVALWLLSRHFAA